MNIRVAGITLKNHQFRSYWNVNDTNNACIKSRNPVYSEKQNGQRLHRIFH